MIRSCSIASLILSITCGLHAAESEAQAVVEVEDTSTDQSDDVIVISPTRSESLRQRSPTVVDVVDAEDLRLRGTPIRTQDQLRFIPGVSFEQNFGGFAGGGGIYIRGGRSYQTQLLIDGIPFNDASSTQGQPGHHLFILPGLERIEVAKGAQSGIYGSGASAGAVDFQGLRPTAETAYSGRVEYGSFDTVGSSAQATGMFTDNLGFAVAANFLKSDGVSAQTSNVEGDPEGHEEDQFERKAISGRLSWEDDFTEVFVGSFLMDSDSDFDGFGKPDDGDSNTKQQSARVHGGVRSAVTDFLDVDADLSYTTYDRRIKQSSDSLYYSTDLYGSLRTTFDVNDVIDLTTAVDLRNEKADIETSTTRLDESERIVGLWAQAEIEWNQLTGQFVIRRDAHSREGDATTYRIGLSYAVLDDDWVIHASTGTGFRAPSLFELYSQYGTLDLNPEENVTYDFGHRLRVCEYITIEQTAFFIGWDEAISFNNSTSKYYNVSPVNNAYVYGVENSIILEPTESLDIQMNFTLQNSDDGSVNNTEMTRVARFEGSVLGVYQQPIYGKPAWMSVGVDYKGSRYYDPQVNDKLPGILNVSAAIGYQPTDEIELTLRGENLTNEKEPTSLSRFSTTTSWTSVPLAIYFGVEASF